MRKNNWFSNVHRARTNNVFRISFVVCSASDWRRLTNENQQQPYNFIIFSLATVPLLLLQQFLLLLINKTKYYKWKKKIMKYDYNNYCHNIKSRWRSTAHQLFSNYTNAVARGTRSIFLCCVSSPYLFTTYIYIYNMYVCIYVYIHDNNNNNSSV